MTQSVYGKPGRQRPCIFSSARPWNMEEQKTFLVLAASMSLARGYSIGADLLCRAQRKETRLLLTVPGRSFEDRCGCAFGSGIATLQGNGSKMSERDPNPYTCGRSMLKPRQVGGLRRVHGQLAGVSSVEAKLVLLRGVGIFCLGKGTVGVWLGVKYEFRCSRCSLPCCLLSI